MIALEAYQNAHGVALPLAGRPVQKNTVNQQLRVKFQNNNGIGCFRIPGLGTRYPDGLFTEVGHHMHPQH
jgi:hypothetical protein